MDNIINIPEIVNSDFMSNPQRNSLMEEYITESTTEEADRTAFDLIVKDIALEADGDIQANVQYKYLKYIPDSTWIILKRRFVVFRMWEKVNQNEIGQGEREEYRLTLENARLNAVDQYGDSLQNEDGKRVGFFIYNNSPTVVKR